MGRNKEITNFDPVQIFSANKKRNIKKVSNFNLTILYYNIAYRYRYIDVPAYNVSVE